MDRKTFLQAAAVSAALLATEASVAEEGERRERSLDGVWAFRQGDSGETWSKAQVPGCWEKDGIPGAFCGPAWYRRETELPVLAPGERLWWELDACSYHAEGYVHDIRLGEHNGLWDPFAWEVPPGALALKPSLTLSLRVEKPGSTRFPVAQTLAGFLPYVWGTHGGIWQSTRLRTTGPARLTALWAPGALSGRVAAEVTIDLAAGKSAVIELVLSDPEGKPVGQARIEAFQSGTVPAPLFIENPQPWSPAKPTLYTLTATVFVDGKPSDRATRQVGFRDVIIDGEQVKLNGLPILFRAPLSWGWYEESRAPNPPEPAFEEELKRCRALGFNGMKLCLWIPPPRYFELADQLGILLWVELPMWLPELSPFSREQAPKEYKRLVQLVGDRPSVVLWTIGCELGKGLEANFLGELYRLVKERTHAALVRDNSGSAECYGGPLPEHADFWDFHLYCDPPLARTTFDSFAPRWRERQPFFFGEFNDQDALRDLPRIAAKNAGKAPWWTQADPQHNPQGVRWEYGVTTQQAAFEANGLLPRLAELRDSSRKQALLTRKHTLELSRSYPWLSGYVITGLVDTPISTAGIFDDLGEARFSPDELLPFNGDTVLFIEPDRRRAWTAGGDRPSWLDRWGAWAGDTVRRHIGVSHYGPTWRGATLTWELSSGERGSFPLPPLEPGTVRELGVLTCTAPTVAQPTKLTLSLRIEADGTVLARNAWPLWVFPKPPAPTPAHRVGLYDPLDLLADLETATGWTPTPLDNRLAPLTPGPEPRVIIATAWHDGLLPLVQRGGRVLYLQPQANGSAAQVGLPAPGLPFFREALRLFDDHPSWGTFPHEKTTDFLFYGLASDCAFAIDGLRATLGPAARLVPVLTRVDARATTLHAYIAAAELGAGKLLLTTLRPYGSLGDQPSGLRRAICGAALLRTWLDWLTS